jgi:diacylglycerol kinase (ATP)
MKKIINSFKYALQGFVQAFKSEKNMKIHMLIALLVILAGIILKISVIEWIICIVLIGIVMSAELFNTAIETTVDLAMPEKNEKAKIAKDVSASAVLILAISSAIIGLIIFIPKITASL